MKVMTLAEAIGGIDDDLVTGAAVYEPRGRRTRQNLKKWTALAACVAAAAVFVGLISGILTDRTQTDPGTEVMIASENLAFYYVSENGAIESTEAYVRCTPKDVFAKWAELNRIVGVTLIACRTDYEVEVTTSAAPNDPNAPVEHFVGGEATLTLVVSAGFERYAESERGALLIEALKQTFFSYSAFDRFDLQINH